jgi:hypothetical protein
MPRKTEHKAQENIFPETSSQRILLEEYRGIYNQYLGRRNEGVIRLNFYITSASVLLGGVLVFGSGKNFPLDYFKIILLSALFILIVVGFEIFIFMIHRDIASDSDLRALARIRNYFAKLDPELEDYFVNSINDTPTGYVARNNSGLRRATQAMLGFLFGSAATTLCSFMTLPLPIYVAIGIGTIVLVFLLFEFNARRRFRQALENAEKSTKFARKVASRY